MKKLAYPIIVIFLLAIAALAIYTQSGLLLLIPVAVIVCFFLFGRCKSHPEATDLSEQQTLKDLIATYGEPDEIIVTDATRGSEAEGALLVYDKGGKQDKGFFVYENHVIDKESITDITFNNSCGTAFHLPDDFQVVISTNDERQPKIHIRAGNDISIVQEIILQMKSCLE